MTDRPQYTATLLPDNGVLFLSLSRTAKIKPEYHAKGREHYHSQAAVRFAVAYWEEHGVMLLHDEVKRTLLKQRQKSELPRPAPKPVKRVYQQEEMRL